MTCKRPYRFVIFKARDTTVGRFNVQVWRWRIVAPNGLIVADGSEGYSSKSNARRAVRRLLRAIEFGSSVEYAD